MKLYSISTSNLHGWIDLDLEFKDSPMIQYMIGSNGVGKTSLLRILHQLSQKNWSYFKALNFENIKVVIGTSRKKYLFKLRKFNGTLYCNTKDIGFNEEKWPRISDYVPEDYKLKSIQQKAIYISALDPKTKRASCGRHWDTVGGAHINDQRLIQLREDIVLKERFGKSSDPALPDVSFLNDFRTEFIETNRLSLMFDGEQKSSQKKGQVDALEYASRRIRQKVNSHFSQAHFEKTVRLDKPFINQLLRDELVLYRDKSIEQLLDEIEKYEFNLQPFNPSRRSDSVEIETASISEKNEEILRFYLSNKLDQLAEHQPFVKEVNIFKELITTSMTNYHVVIDVTHGLTLQRIEHKAGKEIRIGVPLESLSSGAKQLIYMAYRLIFETDPESLVMIDEPEISMHPEWQMRLSSLLEKIGYTKKLKFILATHSPSILNESWENSVPVKPKAK